MKIIDLTVMLSSDMLVFPGAPQIVVEQRFTIAEQGFIVTDLKMDSHAGTHVDAPSHMLENAPGLNDLPMEQFFGPAFMLDVSPYIGGKIPLEAFMKYEAEIKASEFVILHSGWYKKYNTEAYSHDFPNPAREAAEWLAALPALKGVGIDMPTIDHHGLEQLTVHKTLMAGRKLIIENLTNLAGLPDKFTFACFPLKCKGAEGAPCRAVAIL